MNIKDCKKCKSACDCCIHWEYYSHCKDCKSKDGIRSNFTRYKKFLYCPKTGEKIEKLRRMKGVKDNDS